jgi:hypothetical protein
MHTASVPLHPVKNRRTLAHRDAGGGSRPQHQKQKSDALVCRMDFYISAR